MRKLLTIIFITFAIASNACTNLIVGKNASTDGSVMITYSSDSYGSFGWMRHYKAGKHKKGETVACYDYETLNYLGEIPEAEETYNVVGHINEYQVSITETTWGGREELWNKDSTAILDYGCLMFITLQRAKTAREAIKIMINLANTYGYRSEGESITIADKNEAWIVDMIGCAQMRRGVVWVATRIPDDCIAAHANQCRTHRFDQKDKDNVMFAKDVIKFARQMGYYVGKDADFDFANAFNPLDFGGARFCEARAWSLLNRFCEGMDKYLSYASGEDLKAEPFPMYIKPTNKLSLMDVRTAMRDHYEGTPFDIQNDCGGGIWNMPYRPTPLTFKVDDKAYFNERPISTQQPANTMICQMRSWLPDYVGGVIWWAEDDANMVSYTPVYCSATKVPDCYTDCGADAFTFSFKNAYWMCNWVSNMIYPRYSMLFHELQTVRDRLDADFDSLMPKNDAEALKLSKEDGSKMLNEYSCRAAQAMMNEWMVLAQRLIVKYNDMAIKEEEGGKYLKTPGGAPLKVTRPGYSEAYKRIIVNETGDRYLSK